MALKGWGLDPYGTSSYGSSLAGVGVSIDYAIAVSTRTVRVTLSGAVLHVAATQFGDALNPATWTVQQLDTMEFLDPIQVTAITPNVYDVLTLQPFGPVIITHRVGSTTLRDESGGVIVNPRYANFAGLVADAEKDELSIVEIRQVYPRDVANPQVPRSDLGIIGGTLKVNSAGDYETVTGAELVKKLVIRRLLTKPGDFFHLPEYGAGLRVKEPLPASDMVLLKSEIERQVRREIEVEDSLASLTLDGNGILTVEVRARLRGGQQIDTKLPVGLSM